MGVEDKVNQEQDDTKMYVKLKCASGIIEPLLNRPLWGLHTYMGIEGRKELYCPMHQEVYDRIKKREQEDAKLRLGELDGT